MLVDISIPEDPLIISIDPISERKDAEKKVAELRAQVKTWNSDVDDRAFATEANNLYSDIAWDVAKLMLSTTCCYGIVDRRGFRLGIGVGGTVIITKNKQTELTAVTNSGGVSGASVYRSGLVTPDLTWHYHCVAAKAVLREYLSMLSQDLDGPKGELERDKAIALIRVWLLTARHVFSITKKLFPIERDKALQLYVLGSAFVSKGVTKISEVLKEGFSPTFKAADLEGLFLWKGEVGPGKTPE
jgi:hypothetical protein